MGLVAATAGKSGSAITSQQYVRRLEYFLGNEYGILDCFDGSHRTELPGTRHACGVHLNGLAVEAQI